MTLRRIADACGGILYIPEGKEMLADQEVTAIVTDSRQVCPGALFAAIVGERVDGHSFIPSVRTMGAACVLSEKDPEDACGCTIRVRSTLAALRDIAEEYLGILQIPTVGIAGSVGKTSTKEMVASVLSQKYRTLKTAGNFNNELGVPLTIFRLRKEDEIAVLEMGISDFGEMHRLAKIVRPDTCVMTNIGECHLETLKDRDGVFRAKSEMFDFLTGKGHMVLNGEDDKLTRVCRVNGVEPVFYGIHGVDGVKLSYYADEIVPRGFAGTDCRIHTPEGSFPVHVPLPGEHMIKNALAAAAVGQIYHLSLAEIAAGIEQMETVDGRLHLVHRNGLTIIDDCYNANPVSMRASLGVLKDAPGRKVAVLGDMAELGGNEEELHRQIGRYAVETGTDLLVAIGERGRWIADAAQKERTGSTKIAVYDTPDKFLAERENLLQEGDTVLVKASHCMQFERIVEGLCI